MSIVPFTRDMRTGVFLCLICIFLICSSPVFAEKQSDTPEPVLYLNFNEGSGNFALDSSGQGNAGALHNTTRIDSGGCGSALLFSQSDSYVAIPFRALNHPTNEITVSTWFFADTFHPGVLVSGYHNGGYRLGFDDGNDLWWTVNLEGVGDISIPVQHENIAPHQWHQVTGTYDGNTVRIYLDGVLRNQVNATGKIQYRAENYIILGAESGANNTPDITCPHVFHGSLDEVRIYPVALTYGQVMDDRFRCSQEAVSLPSGRMIESVTDNCDSLNGSVRLGANESAFRVLSFPEKSANGTWRVSLPPGSTLRAHAVDAYSKSYPDAWYLEISDEYGKPARTIAFPNRNNAPAEALLPLGNATVLVRYFNGNERFPTHVTLWLESLPPVPPRLTVAENILTNPIIVIYSASWVTLIAIIVVMVCLHRRRKAPK